MTTDDMHNCYVFSVQDGLFTDSFSEKSRRELKDDRYAKISRMSREFHRRALLVYGSMQN